MFLQLISFIFSQQSSGSPIARGVLARPFGARDTLRDKTDAALVRLIRSNESEVEKALIDRVEELAKKKEVSMATIAIAWCLSKKFVNPIVGLGSKERIDQAVESMKWAKEKGLTEEDVKFLEEPYQPKAIIGI